MAGLGSVGVDDEQVARTATNHLLDLGHTRIAHLGGLAEDAFHFPTPHDRYAGYLGALADAGVGADPALDVLGDWSIRGGSTAMDTMLALPPGRRPTAVFASADEMAMGGAVLGPAPRRTGTRRPVGGGGGRPPRWRSFVDLTTVRQPVPEQGRMAAQLLLDELEQRTPRGHSPAMVVPTELVVRGTTGPAPRTG